MLIAISGDDHRFNAQLHELVASQGHQSLVIPLGPALGQTIQAHSVDLVVLAATPACASQVPGILRRLRDEHALRPIPMLCVNPRASAQDVVVCLDAGADDVMGRAFNPQVFVARLRTLLRRRVWSADASAGAADSLSRGPISLKLIDRVTFVDGAVVPLTRLEFDVLAYLIKRPPEVVVPRQEILEAVWNYPEGVETRTLDKHVETLRRKLGAHGSLIETVHGVGYRLAVPRSSKSRA